MKVVLSLDDFSFGNNQMFYLMSLREYMPIKFSMFFIPADYQYGANMNQVELDMVKNQIKDAVEKKWIELIPHGMMHLDGEFQNASYKDMEETLKAYKEFFKSWGVPYVKGFKAPNWLISKDAIKCLDDNGWWLATDRNQPESLKAKKNYVYNWDIKDPFPKGYEVVKGHGHMSAPNANAVDICMSNLSHIPADSDFKFISEII